jgi:hypothetical protein
MTKMFNRSAVLKEIIHTKIVCYSSGYVMAK